MNSILQVMAEYLLVAETSAVTLTIAGVVKEVVTIVVSKIFTCLIHTCVIMSRFTLTEILVDPLYK